LIPADILAAFLTALSYLLLVMRALPYAHDPNVMARSEAQRLSRITRRADIDDAAFLREAAERLSNYVTLWGPKLFAFLQPELRGLLPHLVQLLKEQPFVGRFMELANDFIKTLATQRCVTLDELLKTHQGSGITVAFPGQSKSTTMRIFTTAHDLSKMSDISDSLQKEADLLGTNGTITTLHYDLVSSFLTYVTEILGSPNTVGALMGADGTASAAAILCMSDPFDNVVPPPPPMIAHLLAGQSILTVASKPISPEVSSGKEANSRMDRLEELVRRGILEAAEANRNLHTASRSQYRELMEHAAHGRALQQKQLDQVMPESLSHAPPSSLPKRVLFSEQLFVDNTRTERLPTASTPYRPNPRSGNAPSRDPNASRFGPRVRDQLGVRTTRPPRLDAQGKVILRLMDKPPTPWIEIDEALKVHLSAYGFRSLLDYESRGEEPCVLCGPNADHWTNRCVKIWAGSPKGRTGMGVVRAAEKVRQALARTPQSSEICSITDSLMCFECALANVDSAEEVTADTILYLMDAFGLCATDPAEHLFEAADQADYPAQMYTLGLERISPLTQ